VTTYSLALVGFGNVGKALVRLLRTKRDVLREQHGVEFRVTGVASRRIGWLADENGFDLDALCEGELHSGAGQKAGPSTSPLRGSARDDGVGVGVSSRDDSIVNCANVREWLKAARVDVLFEATSLNRHTGEPAAAHIRAALEHGAHAISANKGPVVFHLDELNELARAKGKRFLYESSVMDGTPIFNMFRHCLPAIDLRGFRGVLNSTTNVILSGMEGGLSFDEALADAQGIGVAESDPTDDIEGWDAAVKTVALTNVLMGAHLTPADVAREGIAKVTGEQVRAARCEGKAYKLVCRASRSGGKVVASVKPELVALSDPLALVEGTSSIIYFETDMFPGLALTEDSAGLDATAYGMFVDFIEAVRH
jgi:homoserine dehydrogenase